MKKIIVIFMIILCTCGIGYLGYLIFRSKNIESVELTKSIQTLYIVGDEIDFEDSKLKVTFKNGDIKMVDLDSKSVEVQYFSTSVEAHGKMNLIYKSEIIPIEYNVVQKGAYYMKDYNSKEYNSGIVDEQNQSYTTENAVEMLYLENGGVCKHYLRDDSKWFMNDGSYNKSYNYTIVGDTMKVTLGEEIYNIKAEYLETGKMQLVYNGTDGVEDTNLVTKQETKVFEHNEAMKTNQTIISAEVYYGKLLSGKEYVDFIKDESFESRNAEVYLKVTYKQYNDGHQFRDIYVKINEKMIVSNFDTSEVRTEKEATWANITYDGIKDIHMFYIVNKKA